MSNIVDLTTRLTSVPSPMQRNRLGGIHESRHVGPWSYACLFIVPPLDISIRAVVGGEREQGAKGILYLIEHVGLSTVDGRVRRKCK